MIIVFTGNGKGKTTAALGQAMRVLGRGKRALVIQFIKGPWRSGEDEFVTKIRNQKARIRAKDASLLDGVENIHDFEIRKMGLGFVGILGDKLPREDHMKAAENALEHFREELFRGQGKAWDLIVLDEINVATSLGLLKKENVLSILKLVPQDKIVILTGRAAPQEFLDHAHLVTEMKEVKHPFNDGKLAKIFSEF
ncbi:MAG: cob(I)yrinic acid a,c-diamide adenosyltransferase [Candidatus Liptonbacteria bacterium]|nr:cob(I)yrinic acid a,c-diamide adenosyltransferase [Candidatus Liptonbacteria bacterium]